MTATHIATARWRALDHDGHDTCRLSRTADGWILSGHAAFRDELGPAELNYVVRCDQNWRTQTVSLTGHHDGRKVHAKVRQTGGQWWFGERPQPDVTGALDIDLSFTPATNLMPLRRIGSGDIALRAAWLQYPCAKLAPLDQVYSRVNMDGLVHYRAEQTKFETDLTVDESGFVVAYPGLWEGEVTRED